MQVFPEGNKILLQQSEFNHPGEKNYITELRPDPLEKNVTMTNSLFEELLRSHGHYLQMGELDKNTGVWRIFKFTLL